MEDMDITEGDREMDRLPKDIERAKESAKEARA
jgi:hypothetical protein